MHRLLVAAWLLATALAGCVSGSETLDAQGTGAAEDPEAARPAATSSDASGPPPGSPDGPAGAASPDPASPTRDGSGAPAVPVHAVPVGWIGAAPGAFGGACAPCPGYELVLDEPAGDGWLDVRIAWDGTRTAGVAGWLELPNGTRVEPQRGFDAVRWKVPGAEAGVHRLHLAGDGGFTGRAALYAVSEPKGPGALRLPNIVAMVPEQVAFGSCDTVERYEQGAQRCLRLGNAIGNVGDGPVEVHLSYDEAALALAGEAAPLDGNFSQRLYEWTGGKLDRPVGASDFHAAHAHWHYDGFARFLLHPVDPESGLRAEAAATGHKAGFCFLDWGRMQEEEAEEEAGGRAEQDCLLPGSEGWSMGISAGHFDFYWSGLTDQYLEASGVGDGLFELVAVADFDDWLVESDESDNRASVLLRIEGDDVQVLERRGWYEIPEGTSNL